MSAFKASSSQYGDWEGTADADNAGHLTLEKYLADNGLKQADEFLIATSLSVGETTFSARAYLFAGQTGFDEVKAALDAHSGPIPVRIVDVDLPLEQYLALFKSFGVMLTRSRLNLEGRSYV